MQLLFNEKLYPITCEMGFIESDFFDVIKFYIKWQSKIFRQYGVKLIKRDVSGNLEYVLKSLLPLISILPNRFLFIPTKSRWIMFLDNSHQGTDAQSSMAYMARKMNCRSLRVVACSDTLVGNTGWLGATILSMYGKDIPGQYNCIRSIGVINEGDEKRDRWSFDQFGTPFDFEDVSYYKKKRKKDRFTFEMLRDYCMEFDLRPFDEDFYLSNGDPKPILLEKEGSTSPDSQEYLPEEIQNGSYLLKNQKK